MCLDYSQDKYMLKFNKKKYKSLEITGFVPVISNVFCIWGCVLYIKKNVCNVNVTLMRTKLEAKARPKLYIISTHIT